MSESEENLEKYYYTCEECDLSFDDYDQHIKDYHVDAEVVLKPLKDEEEDEEEMEVEFLNDAVPVLQYECHQCLHNFSSQKKLNKHKEVAHGPKILDDFFIFAFDPTTKKCKRITFSVNGSSADATVNSLVHRQFYNAFMTAPKKQPLHKEKLPATDRDTFKDGYLDECVLTCEICDSKFPSAGALRLHRKAHSAKPMRSIDEVLPEGVVLSSIDSERYFCEICQRSLDMSFKELHIASHGEQRVFCTICNRKFDTQENLDSHMAALPDHTPFKFGKKFETDPEALKTRQYECGTCGKRFHRPHEKVKHERIHEGTRPFKCEICLKTFRTNTSLVIHLRHHTDLRPYNCHICGRRFNTSGNLKEHVATHFDERNFQCKLCPKAFKTAKGLSGHKLRHGNVFVHKCPKCPRTFSHATSVTKHLLTHDSKSKLDCPMCEAVFSRKDFLQVHIDKDHVDG